jgi:hypothetical protein
MVLEYNKNKQNNLILRVMKNNKRANRRAIKEAKKNVDITYKKKNRIKGDSKKPKHGFKF